MKELDIWRQIYRKLLKAKYKYIVFSWCLILGLDLIGAGMSPYQIDSLFDQLTPTARSNQLIWVDLSNDDSLINYGHLASLGVGGVRLPAGSTHDVPDNFVKAIQLDERLSPAPERFNLPGLNTLVALRDQQLVDQYLDYLMALSHHLDIGYLVLPDLIGDKRYGDLIRYIHAFDPHFFLLSGELASNPIAKRKHFYQFLSESTAVLIDYEKLSDYEKILKKGPKKIEIDHELSKQHFYLAYSETEDLPAANAPMFYDIWSESVIPLQSSNSVLPVKHDTIGVWMADDQSPLMQELGRYFGTVLNVKYDDIPTGVPVIVDGRSNLLLANQYAKAFEDFNPVVWLCDENGIVDIKAAAMIVVPEVKADHSFILAEMMMGAAGIEGKFTSDLPPYMIGYSNEPVSSQRLLSYSQAAWVGMDQTYLDSIDFVMNEMVKNHASPGGQVLVAKSGHVVFHRNYGYLTYDSLIRVQDETLYDIASLTKVNGTLLAVMKLTENGDINLDSAISSYLPEYKGSNKDSISVRELLSHHAGLKSYVPFWRRKLDGDRLNFFYYQSDQDQENDNRSYGYRPDPIMRDSLENWLVASKLIEKYRNKYHYSDLGFMILHQMVEEVSGMSLDNYLDQNFYTQLNLDRMAFNPLNKGFSVYELAPTEYDDYLRDEQVWGNVHDRNAVVFGGVAGHAGLFANAKNLAVLMQMIIQNGEYGGERYLDPSTLSLFNNSYFSGNRRGLGWDKPGRYNPQIAAMASPQSFGHTGFTGTMVWADPAHDLVYIFLSNRVFPNAENYKLNELDVRRRVHSLIYKSISAY